MVLPVSSGFKNLDVWKLDLGQVVTFINLIVVHCQDRYSHSPVPTRTVEGLEVRIYACHTLGFLLESLVLCCADSVMIV